MWNLHRILVVETGFAQWQIFCHCAEVLDLHVSQRICLNHFADLFRGVGGCDQFFVGGNVCSEVTRIQKGRRADSYMDFQGAGSFKRLNQICHCGAAHHGIVDQYNPFSFYHRGQYI